MDFLGFPKCPDGDNDDGDDGDEMVLMTMAMMRKLILYGDVHRMIRPPFHPPSLAG